MQFNNTTDEDGIIQMQEQTTTLGLGNISGDSSLLAYFTVLTNNWYRIAAFYAYQSDNRWVYDDRNHGTFPRYKTDIVDGQRDYQLPTEVLNIRQVEVRNSDGKYYTLKFLSEDDPRLNIQKEQENAAQPIYYRLNGSSIILDPKPDASTLTTTDGLRITTDREIDGFTTSDTTQEADLPEKFQPILYYGPSFEYASINNLDSVKELCSTMLGGFDGLDKLIKQYYADRNQDDIPRIQRAYKSYK
jgi:hypothetical protein